MLAAMAQIVLLGLGAAVFPLLLACVAILLSRPHPRTLMLAFWLGGMTMSILAGLIVLDAFKSGNDVLGNSSSNPHPWVSIAGGLVALALAWFLWSGRAATRLAARKARRTAEEGPPQPSWAEQRLNRAGPALAATVGAVINLPGPFYLLALGDIAKGGYSGAQQLGLILLFNVTMFLLLEVPLLGYLVRPERTAVRVAELSRWLNANGLRVMGALVGLAGVSLLAQGIVAAL